MLVDIFVNIAWLWLMSVAVAIYAVLSPHAGFQDPELALLQFAAYFGLAATTAYRSLEAGSTDCRGRFFYGAGGDISLAIWCASEVVSAGFSGNAFELPEGILVILMAVEGVVVVALLSVTYKYGKLYLQHEK